MLDEDYAQICFNCKPKRKLSLPKQQLTFKSKQEIYQYLDNLQAQVKLPPKEHQQYLNSFRLPHLNESKPQQCSRSVLVQRKTSNNRVNSLMSELNTLESSVLITLQFMNDNYQKEKRKLQEEENKYALLLDNLDSKSHITNTNWKTLIKHHFETLNEYKDFAKQDILEEKNFVYSHQISTRHHYLFVDNEMRRNFLRKKKARLI